MVFLWILNTRCSCFKGGFAIKADSLIWINLLPDSYYIYLAARSDTADLLRRRFAPKSLHRQCQNALLYSLRILIPTQEHRKKKQTASRTQLVLVPTLLRGNAYSQLPVQKHASSQFLPHACHEQGGQNE